MKGDSKPMIEAKAIRTHDNRIRKIYQFGAILIAVAMISSALTLIVTGDGPSGFNTVIEPGSQVITPQFVVFDDSGTYYVRNGMSGEIEHSGASAATAIQYAIDELTPARSSKEKVMLKGDFSLSASIILESYTIIELDGTITLANSIGLSMLKTTAYTTDFEVIGGLWDGNEAGQTPAAPSLVSFIFEFVDAHSGVIRGVTLLDSSYDCLIIGEDCSDIMVIDCIADGARDDGFNPLLSSSISFVGCIARNIENDGFHISDGTVDITVSGCIAHDNGNAGFLEFSTSNSVVFSSSISYENAYGFYLAGRNATIQGCIARDNTVDGIFISASGVANPATHFVLVANEVFDNGGKGINCGGRDVLIIGCDIHDNTGTGIYLTGALDIAIDACMIEANGASGIIAGSTVLNITITNSLIYANTGYGILMSGQRAIFAHNIFNGNTGNNIHLATDADYAQIIGNTMIGGDSGIYIAHSAGSYAYGMVITGNSVLQPATWGIYMYYANGSIISQNYIDGPRTGAGATPYDSIAIKGCNSSLIQANHCVNANRYDLNIYSGTIGVRVYDNYFGESSVLDSGTSTDFRDNIGYTP